MVGAGSWGTALARLTALSGHPTTLWSRNQARVNWINEQRVNPDYLPQIPLPPALRCSTELNALKDAQIIIWAIPSHGFRQVLEEFQPLISTDACSCVAIKGIEQGSLHTMATVMEHAAPTLAKQSTYLGGPSFAREVATDIPTAVTLASRNPAALEFVQTTLHTPRFRVYSTDDVTGVEIGGALKNVMAIAVGASEGLGFGHNTRAALITRGLTEITRIAVAMGANPLTLAGLGGLGDLVLTCTGDLSRNRTVGLRLGRGESLEHILSTMTMVAEGVRTAESAHSLIQKHNVEAPIVTQVYQALYEGKTTQQAVHALLSRPAKSERI